MSTEQNVQVIVRVRPFSQREIESKSKCIVCMQGNTTSLFDPKHPNLQPKLFTFDKSYWSHDGYEENDKGYAVPTNEKYVDQSKIFVEIGMTLLECAWSGYNSTIFAYGQTGSGKSYTIMGYEPNIGLVPSVCQKLFQQISSRKVTTVQCEVTFSMVEIYNELVRDLLLPLRSTQKQTLQVKERPDKGFFADGLIVRPVEDFRAIRASMAEGDRNRTLAATKMNETSSRAHTIVTISLHQRNTQCNTTKFAFINLVDLAGSERQKQTQATGDRFKESANINQSLSTLGNVIKALCDQQVGKNVNIPYRDSNLTKLLKNALGGNSKTYMVAAISPAEENYDQTLSTLKYADRAKSIRNHAKVNETQTDKLVRELIAEKERLLKELEKSTRSINGRTDEEIELLRREHQQEINRYKQEMSDLQKSWEERLLEQRRLVEEYETDSKRKETTAHLSNLNEDPNLCDKNIHLITGVKNIGTNKSRPPADIVLHGPSIHQQHATIKLEDGKISLIPRKGKVYLNGAELSEPRRLNHNDRICFGANSFFVLIDPLKRKELIKKGKNFHVTFEFAQKEIAKDLVSSIEEDDENLMQEVLSIMPRVQQANAIATELKKSCTFEIVLVSPFVKGEAEGSTEVFVKMRHLDCGTHYLWDKNKFLNRQARMMELYYLNEDQPETALYSTAEVDDPFWEPPDLDCILGIVAVPLTHISLMEPYEDTLTVVNYEAEQVGNLVVAITPCNKNGDDSYMYNIEQKIDLVGQSLHFKVKVLQALNLPRNYSESWCAFKFYQTARPYVGAPCPGINPKYNFEALISVPNADHEFVKFVDECFLYIEIWGHQSSTSKAPRSSSSLNAQHGTELAKIRSEVAVLQRCLRKVCEYVDDAPYCFDCDETICSIKRVITEAKQCL